MDNMTPKERVFGTLRNLQRLVDEAEDLNEVRDRIAVAIDRCLSWEGELINLDASAQGSALGQE